MFIDVTAEVEIVGCGCDMHERGVSIWLVHWFIGRGCMIVSCMGSRLEKGRVSL